jgi:hypothetical protein
MVERHELITTCRQIGAMMEAGVDILRITRVLRAQTENPRLLSLYDALDHDLRMGESIGDAMEHAPDVFSPFAISMVRQGEAQNNLAGAFAKLADFLQKDQEIEDSRFAVGTEGTPAATPTDANLIAPTAALLTVNALDGLLDRLQVAALRILTILAGLLLTLGGVWWSVEVGLVERRWLSVLLYSVAALFISAAGVWMRRRMEEDRKQGVRCSFCGEASGEDSPLQHAPRFTGAAICARCATTITQHYDGHAPVAGATPSTTPPATTPQARQPDATPQAFAGTLKAPAPRTEPPVSREQAASSPGDEQEQKVAGTQQWSKNTGTRSAVTADEASFE